MGARGGGREHRGDRGDAALEADLAQAKAATLMVSLDASLRYIPLAVLHDGRQYLAERYAKEITFTAKPDAPARQQGQVVFTFTLE